MNESEKTALSNQVRESKQYCVERFPESWRTQIYWSNRMTSSIGSAEKGSVEKGSPNIIKLSGPIVRGILKDRGLEAALRAVNETVKHEFAHVAVKFADAPAHGQEWAANMRTLGLDPGNGRYHHHKCGRELFSDSTLRAQFSCGGTEVIFQYKSIWYRGSVSEHKVKKVYVKAKTKLVAGKWLPIERQFTFTCPWSIAKDELHLIQDSK